MALHRECPLSREKEIEERKERVIKVERETRKETAVRQRKKTKKAT